MSEPPDYVVRNRASWDECAKDYEEPGRRNWSQDEPPWGTWSVPESELHVLPRQLVALDVIELGCGTGYVSAWLARRGARPVGIDNSEAQLSTARALQREFGLEFPLLHGNAEEVPLPGAGFDLAISEYGASIWCDPYRWIPEAARLLRPGGQLIFLVNGVLAMLTTPNEENGAAADRLLRPYFGMHRVEWSGDDSVEFHLPHGEMIALLRRSGFAVQELLEIRPPDGSTTRYPYITLDWAQRWPCEEVWKAQRLERRPDPDHRGRHLFELTASGRELCPVLRALLHWGARHRHGNSRVFKRATCGTTLDEHASSPSCEVLAAERAAAAGAPA